MLERCASLIKGRW